jgi:hypothetical protein
MNKKIEKCGNTMSVGKKHPKKHAGVKAQNVVHQLVLTTGQIMLWSAQYWAVFQKTPGRLFGPDQAQFF